VLDNLSSQFKKNPDRFLPESFYFSSTVPNKLCKVSLFCVNDLAKLP